MTPAQKRALNELKELGGSCGVGFGIRKQTALALAKLGYVEFKQGKRREELSPGGWTGRVYVRDSWFISLTEEGRNV